MYNVTAQDRFCPFCTKPARFYALVDVTNGYGVEYGGDAVDAPMKEIGFTDVWHEDHYQNRYATKHITFEPVGDRWIDLRVITTDT